MPNQYTGPIPLEERFWPKVDRSGGSDACWLWLAGLDNKGYGRFTGTKEYQLAHRIAWELTNGPIPDGVNVLHDCPDGDNPRCCNPAHLWLGTQLENIADRDAKGRTARGDRSGPRLYPERLLRGDDHWTHKHPEKVARGDNSGARLHPERLARGERHGSRTKPESMLKGEKNAAAILTWDKVRAIRAAYAAGGVSYTELARQYEVTKGTIAHIIQGRNWLE